MDFFEKLVARMQRKEDLVKDTSYMEWLYEFTKTFPSFRDTQWLYEKDDRISSDDQKQIEILQDFFTAIQIYHTKNLLESNGSEHQCWYNIKYNNDYFAIGILIGQGATNFVTRYESYEELRNEKFIEFKDIMEDKVALGFEQRKAGLQQLSEFLTKLYDMGIPKAAVEEVFKKSLIS